MPLFSQPVSPPPSDSDVQPLTFAIAKVSTDGVFDGAYIMAIHNSFDLPAKMIETLRQQELGLLEDDLVDLSTTGMDVEDLPTPNAQHQLDHTPSPSPAYTSPPYFDLESLSPLTSEAESSPELDSKQRRKRKKKQQSRQQKKKRRAKARLENYGNVPPKVKMTKRHAASFQPIQTSAEIRSSEVTSAAFVALNKSPYPERVFTLEELIGKKSQWKFKLVQWDGIKPIPIVDKGGIMIGLLVGRPNTPEWVKLMEEAAAELEQARRGCHVSDKWTDHRRGVFTTLRTGFSHGGGQPHPMNLSNNTTNQQIIDQLNAHEAFKRIASLTSTTFQSQFPDLHKYYVEKLSALQTANPTLKKPFADSVFSSTTYNLGPQTECLPHVDFANLAFGLCAVTALGTFDAQAGGHLILWELGLVIEFPPGSTILIPSAIINHSNVAISEGERRYSFTQYSAGGLFRWVEHGNKTVEKHRKSLTRAELATLDEKNLERWSYGLSLLPRLL